MTVSFKEWPGFYYLHRPGLFFIPAFAEQLYPIIQSILHLFCQWQECSYKGDDSQERETSLTGPGRLSRFSFRLY